MDSFTLGAHWVQNEGEKYSIVWWGPMKYLTTKYTSQELQLEESNEDEGYEERELVGHHQDENEAE
jgi:hypothetical protein